MIILLILQNREQHESVEVKNLGSGLNPGFTRLLSCEIFSKLLKPLVSHPSISSTVKWRQVFPDSSVGKESACNAGDPGSIPGSGRSVGEGIGYPLQYSWVFLVAQLVKNPPAMWETWVQSLGWEDPPEKGIPLENSTDCIVCGVTKSHTRLSEFHFT